MIPGVFIKDGLQEVKERESREKKEAEGQRENTVIMKEPLEEKMDKPKERSGLACSDKWGQSIISV